jgi:hypothetical protein
MSKLHLSNDNYNYKQLQEILHLFESFAKTGNTIPGNID